MPTRRDQLQSYQFMMQRVLSAFAYHDTDPVQPAGRRLLGAGLAGVMVAVLAVAIVGVLALLRPGGKNSWRDGRAVIVERETGTRFVFRNGTLYPMANFASAALAVRSRSTSRVSANSLRGVPRGPLLGIVGAPDALPPAKRLVGTPWTICVEPADNGGGRQSTVTILHVGRPATGGRDLGDDALLAQAADTGRFFLIWHRRRYAISDKQVAFTALGLDQQPTTVVDEAWLNALPAGQPLAPTVPAGVGTPSTAVGGARVGQVYVVQGAGTGRQFFVVADARRLASISEVEANFLLADPEIARAAYPGERPQQRTLTLTEAATADKLPPADRPADAPPTTVPRIAGSTSAGAGACAEFSTVAGAPRLVTDVPANDSASASVTTGRTADGVALVTRVDVRPGAAAVVEAMPAPGAPTGTSFLVTDLGVRHAFAGPEARAALGYGAVKPVRMPADLVARIPTGPPLDAVAAGSPVQRR
jgi:type VII secretion protein EccB